VKGESTDGIAQDEDKGISPQDGRPLSQRRETLHNHVGCKSGALMRAAATDDTDRAIPEEVKYG
jgi:hypothetical protein